MTTPAGRWRGWLFPDEPARLTELRERAAVVAALGVACTALVVSTIAVLRPHATLPDATRLLAAALPVGVLGVFGRRAAFVLRQLLPVYVALGIVSVSTDAQVHAQMTPAVLLPGILAALLSRPFGVVASLAVVPVGMGLRGGWDTPYLAPESLLLIALSALVLVAAQVLMVRAHSTARSLEQRLATIGSETSDLALLYVPEQPSPTIIAGSPERVLGLSPEAFLKSVNPELVHPDDLEAWRALAKPAWPGAPARTGEVRLKHQAGHWVSLSARASDLTRHPDVGGIVVVMHDVTAARMTHKVLEEMLVHEAEHDGLTGLPNRRWLMDKLEQELGRVRAGGQAAVVLVDLDDFNVVNDALGHQHGDLVLTEVARRLSALVTPDEVVTRVVGDEFAVLFPGVGAAERAASFCMRFHERFQEPVEVAGERTHLTAALGLARLSPAHERPEDVLRDCDLAMREAKSGEHPIAQFEDGMREKLKRRHELERALRGAIAKNHFFLVYQPKVSIADGTLVGVEALVRWRDPQRGVVPPLDFIPLAEETGLIVPIGDWVLREAGRQIRAWRQAFPQHKHLRMAVNLSAVEATREDAVLRVARAMQDIGAEPDCLELEVTETAAMTNAAQMVEKLQGLRGVGVRLAIDDFGTGYSSLSYLRRFPFNVLKIDRAFVRRLTEAEEDKDLVRFLVSLARALELETVAEGVETDAQLAMLKELGCDVAQGYLIAHPMPPEEIEVLLAATPFGSVLARPGVPGTRQ